MDEVTYYDEIVSTTLPEATHILLWSVYIVLLCYHPQHSQPYHCINNHLIFEVKASIANYNLGIGAPTTNLKSLVRVVTEI